MAAADFFLKLEGIDGESGDSKHKGEIEVQSFSWGATNSGSHSAGGGGGAGKVILQDFHFTMSVNKASAKLMQFCCTGEHIKKATLTVRKSGKEQQEYYVVKMEDLLVSSYQSGGHSGGDPIPTDQFSLNFTKILYDYKPQKADGSLDAAQHGGWDVKANKTV